jgi:alpha-galactosidase
MNKYDAPVLIWLTASLLLGTALSRADVSQTEISRTWIDSHFDRIENLPFSFQVDQEPSSRWLTKSQATREIQRLDDHRTRHGFLFKDSDSGLQVRCECISYRDFPAVEWVVYLKNTGTAANFLLQKIQALDLSLPGSKKDPVLHYAKGAVCSWDDFQPLRRVLNKNTTMQVQPGGGRSSSDYLPFFNLEQPEKSGLVIAIGWSGEWQMQIATDSVRSAKIRSGLPITRIRLNPGEEIRTPAITLLFYEKEWLAGQNMLRLFVLAHHRPLRFGQPFPMPLFDSSWGGTPAATHLADIQQIIAADLAIDYYWIDAEWFGQGKWHQAVGDWRVNKSLYPAGFKPISDLLHGAKRSFLLWFEPERVCQGTRWYTQLSSWMLSLPKEQRQYNWGKSQFEPDWVLWESRRNQICENDRLFNLADPAARKILGDSLSAMINEFGIDCFRHDANIAPLEFWRAHDSADRQGCTEIHWVEGLYALWDELLQRHPGLIIDNCASGGRRIDLESISRTTPFWRTDYPGDPIAKQCHTYGLSLWIPLNATGNTRPATDDLYTYRSTFSSSMVVDLSGIGQLDSRDPQLQRTRKLLQQYREVQKYFLGDYYPLTCYSQAADAWMAWQFNRPDSGDGMIQVFRRPQSISETGKLALFGLESDQSYEVIDQDQAVPSCLSGRTLMSEGWPVILNEKPSAAILFYKKK